MNQQKTIIVPAESNNQRLDLFLSEHLKITRSQAQKLIEQRQVLVNKKMPKKMGEKIKAGDKIEVQQPSPSVPLSKGEGSRPPSPSGGRTEDEGSSPQIITETPDYLVVEKPTGMLTHPTMASEKNTLVNFLIKKYPTIKKVGDDPSVRPGIVHRLDKEASGLLVVARTQKMFNHLKEQFKNRTIEKEYYALAHGKIAKDWDILTFPIARSKTHDRMAARPIMRQPDGVQNIEPLQQLPLANGVGAQYFVPSITVEEQSSDAKDAKTEFLVERRFVNFTLFRVTLHTGRMHQIRVHLLAYNHPLVGDPLYFQKKRKRAWDEKLGRLFLHSTKLSFTDLEGQKQTFESSLPKELEEFLKLLK